jgi:hypothetical protein
MEPGVVSLSLFSRLAPDSSPTTNGLCLTGCVGHIMAPSLRGSFRVVLLIGLHSGHAPSKYQRAAGQGQGSASVLVKRIGRAPWHAPRKALPATALLLPSPRVSGTSCSAQCLALAWKATKASRSAMQCPTSPLAAPSRNLRDSNV